MTTPPLDLTALREHAYAATPGEWTSYGYRVETVPEFDLHRFDVMGEMVAECDLREEDARHIAAFDPPTALALLDRLEDAEKKVAAVREALESKVWQYPTMFHIEVDVIDVSDVLEALDGVPNA